MKKRHILVTGGAGFVGSHIIKQLHRQGYYPITLDNLSRGSRAAVVAGDFVHSDIANTKALDDVFTKYPVDAVMHFAAFIEIGESMRHPAKYYDNNVCNTFNLLEAMRRHNIHHFVFSSSAGIFGYPQSPKIDEDHPTRPISPYGKSKLMIEMMLEDYDAAFGIKSTCLRYFNAAGGDPEGHVKNHKSIESNLIPIILKSLLNKEGSVTLFGTDYPTHDGTCVRDYIHVDDLGKAHISALENLLHHQKSSRYNLGNGNGYSILQVVDAIKRVTGKKVNVTHGDRRPGDPPVLIADSSKAAKELGWSPQYSSLETIVEHAWKAIIDT